MKLPSHLVTASQRLVCLAMLALTLHGAENPTRNATITGQVSNAATQFFLVGAVVLASSGQSTTTDREGRFLIRNPRLSNFVGDWPPSLDPVRSARWRAWDSEGRLLDRSEWPGMRALRGETVNPGREMLYTEDDGKQIWTRVASVPFRDQAGELSGVVANRYSAFCSRR